MNFSITIKDNVISFPNLFHWIGNTKTKTKQDIVLQSEVPWKIADSKTYACITKKEDLTANLVCFPKKIYKKIFDQLFRRIVNSANLQQIFRINNIWSLHQYIQNNHKANFVGYSFD